MKRSSTRTLAAPAKPIRETPALFDTQVDATYDRHLVFDHVVSREAADARERFEAVARTLRDLLTERWLKTDETYDQQNPKRVYYLSMEFLIGRTLVNNVVNLGAEKLIQDDLVSDPRLNWAEVVEAEPDAGLGNGGLGRLAACFIESMATLGIPAIGYGLRYEYGIFRQEIEKGRQAERPDNWLRNPDPWEVARPRESVECRLDCSFRLDHGIVRPEWDHTTLLLGVPFDRPVVGYGGKTVNTLRLWGAESPDIFGFREFSSGDFVGAMLDRTLAQTITRVLYPDDSTQAGQALRFVQEYFLVCCSLADIVRRFRRSNDDWNSLPDKVAIQLNDTHPALAVAELMRILLDDAGLGWDQAWDLTVRTLAYTNHTLLPEALERWPVRVFELVCPRLLEIVHEIDRRFLDVARRAHPGDEARVQRLRIIEEGENPQVRMAHLAVVGGHSVNGVAALHSRLLGTRLLADFASIYPDRFNNKTNGVTPRRWLLAANPRLAKLISDAIGETWISDARELRRLLPLAQDATFQERFLHVKRAAKVEFSNWVQATCGVAVDPDSIFDCQIKRIHEYKRQLLNVLHVVSLYDRLLEDPNLDLAPRTFFFAGKAAPAYQFAKLIIKLVNDVARTVNDEPRLRDRLKVAFLPNYSVSLAERLLPASDVSEQISTAGYEASGTGNMKFMMNGALTVGTRDGATIEMAEEAGEANFFLFGLTAEQVEESRGWYDPRWHYDNEQQVRRTLDTIFQNRFNADEAGIYEPIRETLLDRGDRYMHLADFTSYAAAHRRVDDAYRDPPTWARMAIANVAGSGKFSSDRAIAEYASDIWKAKPCSVD